MTKRREKSTSKKSRRHIMPPVLIITGIGIAIIASIITLQQNPAASPRTIISNLINPPYIIGAAVGLTAIGIIAMFIRQSKETKRTSFRAFLMLLAAFLVFGGPTYLVYVLQQVITLYPFVLLLGIASLMAGLLLFARLIKEK
jgi:FtsH-binding integral membrane protein